VKRNVINVSAIIISGIALVLCALGAVGLHRWQLSRIATGLLGHSQAAEEKLDWYKSAEYLDRYLRIKPTDAPARGRLHLPLARPHPIPKNTGKSSSFVTLLLAPGMQLMKKPCVLNCLTR
jgi:hypothetical protein